MQNFLSTPLGRFRLVSLLEGISYLILMGIGMPMKYMMGDPTMVQIFGRIHGGLFVVFVLAMVHALVARTLEPGRASTAFALSLVPFGAFVVEWMFRKDETTRP